MPGVFLLIGGDSEIGAATASHMRRLGLTVASTTRRHERVAADRPFLDLVKPLESWQPPPDTRAACIFAAIGHLLDCARDPAGSAHLNVTQTLALVRLLHARDIPVLFLSTDKVFDGTHPLVPADAPTCPASEYGRQKARTEAALLQQMTDGAPIAILRLSKIVSPGMALLQQWIAALTSGSAVRAFHDLMMAPVPVALVATAVSDLLAAPASGIFQLSGSRDISYAEVAAYLAREIGAAPELVTPVSAYSAGMPAGATPRYTTLDSRSICGRLGAVVPDPWKVIEDVIEARDARAPLGHG
jgi:dTDP-4-dehydrorhamnose reductase